MCYIIISEGDLIPYALNSLSYWIVPRNYVLIHCPRNLPQNSYYKNILSCISIQTTSEHWLISIKIVYRKCTPLF